MHDTAIRLKTTTSVAARSAAVTGESDMGGESRYLGLAYIAPYIIGLLVFTAIPFGASLYLSFTDYSLMNSPVWVGLDNFERLFTRDRTFVKSLTVTLSYVALTVPLKLAFALFIAVILNAKMPCHRLLPHRLLRPLDPRRLDRDRGAVALHLLPTPASSTWRSAWSGSIRSTGSAIRPTRSSPSPSCGSGSSARRW